MNEQECCQQCGSADVDIDDEYATCMCCGHGCESKELGCPGNLIDAAELRSEER